MDPYTEVWNLLHQATANYLYHGAMAARWQSWNAWVWVAGTILTLAGLVFGMWLKPREESEFEADKRARSGHLWAFGAAAVGVILPVLTNSVQQAQHAVLKGDWLAMKGELEDLLADTADLKEGEQLNDTDAARLSSLRLQKTVLLDKETGPEPSNKELSKYWEEANEKLYGYGVRTAAQAEAHLEQLRKARAEKNRAPGDS